jgi:signal transduction histidine kinase
VSRIVLPRLLRVASFKFAALYVAVFAGSALVLGVAVFLEARSALQQQMAARIETEAAFLQEEFRAEGLAHLLDLVRKRGQGASALDYLVEDQAGAHLAGEMPATADPKPGWTTIDVPQASEDGGRPEKVLALVSDLGGGVLLAVGGDLRQIGELEEAIATAFLWTVGLAAVLGISGGALLSRAFLRRVDAIARTAEAIIDGDLGRRMPMRGTGDDLDRLASTLNRMLDRIGVLMESLRQVSSDVAHDLRTPLSRLYQRLEDARAHARSMAEYESAIDAALSEAEGLLETFSALLRIAQVEGASPRAGFRDVDLTAVAETVSDAYRLDAEDAGHQLTATISPGITVSGDQELLTQALANLVENALRHTPLGTRIGVRLTGSSEADVTLSVEDDGPGVAAIDLPRLTDRFYRGERSRTTPGNGLGLSLVSAVAELHGAKLSVDAMEPGLRVSLLFPAAERALLHASRLSLPSSSIPRVPVTPPASCPEGRQPS